MNPPADQNAFLFHSLHRAHRNAVLSALSAKGLADVGQPMILFLLEQTEAGSEMPAQKDLAERLHVTPATIANSLKSLERMGYITKSTDARDGRKKRVSITEKGRAAVRGCEEVFHSVDEQMHRGLSPEENEELLRCERIMLENLRKIGGDRDLLPPPPPRTF